MRTPVKGMKLWPWILALLLAGGSGTVLFAAENLDAVKARMVARQATVDDLRDRQVAGENNRGFLDPRGNLSGPEQQALSDENADRRSVYAALAAQTGASVDTVGRQRAQQIAMRAKRGVWIQEASGEWRQK